MQATRPGLSASELQLLNFPQPTFQSGGSQGTIASIPPVDEIHFYPVYRTFCFNRGIKGGPPSCDIQDRPVELHRLHAEVLKAGGYLKVSFFYCLGISICMPLSGSRKRCLGHYWRSNSFDSVPRN